MNWRFVHFRCFFSRNGKGRGWTTAVLEGRRSRHHREGFEGMDTEGVEKGCGVADIERDDEVGEK